MVSNESAAVRSQAKDTIFRVSTLFTCLANNIHTVTLYQIFENLIESASRRDKVYSFEVIVTICLSGRVDKESRLTIQWSWLQISIGMIEFPLNPVTF